MLRRHTFALLRETHQQFLSAPVGIPLEPRIDAVVFYLPLFHLVEGGIGQVARYRLHGLVDTKEMGTDRTSAEIFLQGVGPLPDLIALAAHHPRGAAVKIGDDVPDLVDFTDAGFNGFVRRRLEAKRRTQPLATTNRTRNIHPADADGLYHSA